MTVGIFQSHDDAEEAIDRLSDLGLDEGSIHVLTRRGVERGGDTLFASLARAFRGEGDLSGELTRLGVDSEEAVFYEEELEDEGVLLAVETDDDDQGEVLAILREANATTRG